jgi:RNA polymerase sigma-70 factor (ECF subfamily)
MQERREFAERVQPLWRPLFAFASRLAASEQDAEDILQDSLAAAFRARRAYDGERPFRAWLAGFVVRCASNRNRRKRPFLRPAEELEQLEDRLAAEWDYERILARPEAALDWIGGALSEAVRALPAGEREALLLRSLLDLSYKDIAAVSGAPMGTVMSRLHRARAAVRLALVRREIPR